MNDRETAGSRAIDVPAVRAGLVGVCLLFACLAVFSLFIGRAFAGALYGAAFVVLTMFLVETVRFRTYSSGFWQAECAFFLAWMVALRLNGGGFHHSTDSIAVIISVVAVTLGRGFGRRVVVVIAIAVPIVLRLFEAAWPSVFYFPQPLPVARVGTALELLAVASIFTVLLDRILAAYFNERVVAERRSAELSRLIATDGLTGLANRRALMDRLEMAVDDARRSGNPLSLVLVDLDDFKAINDSRGHLAGDDVLRKIAGTIARGVGDGDMAGRYGGDEFMLILPGRNRDEAFEIAQGIRVAVESTVGSDNCCTISAGVQQYGGGDAARLIADADRGLYDAKNAGRNRVECHG